MTAPLILEARNLTKTLGRRKVIDRINLKVQQGDVYGFLGRNGQGKTTVIRLLTGLVFPDSGEVLIGGRHLQSNFKQAIAQVGAIVESPAAYDYLSGYDNLKLMANLIPNLPRSRIDEVLNIVGLAGRGRDKVRTYSLGMKQRLGIAGALLGYPKLIILDEPTNGLDPQGMKEMNEMIAQLAAHQCITFFISSHLLHDMQQLCNRVGIIHGGRLMAEGDVHELAAQAKDRTLQSFFFEMTRE